MTTLEDQIDKFLEEELDDWDPSHEFQRENYRSRLRRIFTPQLPVREGFDLDQIEQAASEACRRAGMVVQFDGREALAVCQYIRALERHCAHESEILAALRKACLVPSQKDSTTSEMFMRVNGWIPLKLLGVKEKE